MPAKGKATTGKKKPVHKIKYQDDDARLRGDGELSIIGHLNEFRSRVLTALIVLIVATSIPFFFFGEKILTFITAPYYRAVGNSKLQIFTLMEGFTLQLKSSLIAGILIAIPVILFQVWKFVVPAIGVDHRKFLRNTLIVSVLLFYGGAAFTFFFFGPYTIKMLLTFMPKEMELTINASSYLNFMVLFCAAMGAVFEMPLVIMILTRLGIISPATLAKKRKWAIVIIWIIAAIITPTTDILTQSLVAIPLMFLYEISIIISRIMLYRKARSEAQ